MLFLSSLFLSFPFLSIKILPPRIYHAIPREGETTKERESISNRIPSWRNSRSGQRIKKRRAHQKAIKRVPAAGLHNCFAAAAHGHRGKGRSKKGGGGGEGNEFITLFEACLSTADSARGSGDGCVLFRATRPFFQRGGEREEEGRREAKGWKQEKWRAEGKKLRRHAVMDWPGPITSFVSICAEYCS